MTTAKRPDLKEPVLKLLSTLKPAASGGGDVSLSDLVLAVAGDRLAPGVKAMLDKRGDAHFDASGAFANDGPETKIELKSFNLKIPKHLAGRAEAIEGGVLLTFEKKAALQASKLFVSIGFVSIELTDQKIHVKMEQSTFDQVYELN